MSVPNAVRDDEDGNFLDEDIDMAAWISKVSADVTRTAFMDQMKVVFGSRVNFDTAFSGFAPNLLRPDHEANMWLTDAATPIRVGTTIHKGSTSKSQTAKSEKFPKGPDFLALVLEHCALTRSQIENRIIPYMIRQESKWPCSRAGRERAAYQHFTQRPTVALKGKRPVAGSLQSRLSVHAPTPVRAGESSRQRLDEDLESYSQVHNQVLPYDEEPAAGEPPSDSTVVAPATAGTNNALHDESNMDIDPELDHLYD